MKKIAVIGGGASGLVAAIFAGSANTEVTILERNASCGKKLLITGNGKCNYWNEDTSLEHFHSNEEILLSSLFTEKNLNDAYSFLRSLGIIPFVRNGYYYPFSNQATTIKNALLLEISKRNIEVVTDCYVENIVQKDKKFQLETNKGAMYFDSVIVATGSKACPKTGSDGNGYSLLKSLNHSVTPIFPSLVQLVLEGSFMKKWHGIRSMAEVSLYQENKLIKKEYGEVQLTDYGLSGICVFHLSRYIKEGVDNYIHINFLPFLEEDAGAFFERQNSLVYNRSIGELLESILNYKLVLLLLSEAHLDYHKKYEELSVQEKETLVQVFTNFKVRVINTLGFTSAQVCAGGVSLKEIDIATCESMIVPNLYIVGELLDVDGDCGGYNLMNAFITGMLAGKGVVSRFDQD